MCCWLCLVTVTPPFSRSKDLMPLWNYFSWPRAASLSVETGKTASIRHWPVTGPGTASVEKGHEKQVQLLLSLLPFMQHMKRFSHRDS